MLLKRGEQRGCWFALLCLIFKLQELQPEHFGSTHFTGWRSHKGKIIGVLWAALQAPAGTALPALLPSEWGRAEAGTPAEPGICWCRSSCGRVKKRSCICQDSASRGSILPVRGCSSPAAGQYSNSSQPCIPVNLITSITSLSTHL